MRNLSTTQKKQLEAAVRRVTPEDERKVRRSFSQAEVRAKQKGAARKLLDGVRTLWHMLTDPDFVIDWQVKAWIVSALGYFVTPWDLIPDVLPGVGYIDDALVVTWVLHQLSDEVAAYRKWKGLA